MKNFKEEFELLVKNWHKETDGTYPPARLLHISYRRISTMGMKVVPLILRDLIENGGNWFPALEHITGSNPVPPNTKTFSEKKEAWLKWAEKNEINY